MNNKIEKIGFMQAGGLLLARRSGTLRRAGGKYAGEAGNNGFDIVAYKGSLENPTEIVIVECKQMNNGAVKLNPPSKTTDLPAQMSDGWIRYDAGKLRDAGKIDAANLINNAPIETIQKYVVAVDKSKGEINFLKLGNYDVK